MFEVAYMEFKKNGELATKRKEFKTEAAMQKFIERLFEKDNFYQIIATR